jgi:hypothetical protein
LPAIACPPPGTSQRALQSIWADTAQVKERVAEVVAVREAVVVDSTRSIETRPDTTLSALGDTTVVMRSDTTWTPVYYQVSASEREAIDDSLMQESLDRIAVRLVDYEDEVARKAAAQHVGLLAEEAYRLSRIVAPEAADPSVMNGNHVQAALVLAVQELYRQNVALQNRLDAMQASFDSRLKALESP